MSKHKRPEFPADNCDTCKYWKEETDSADEIRWGLCCESPPVPMNSTDDEGSETITCIVPWTELPFGCGRHKPRLQ